MSWNTILLTIVTGSTIGVLDSEPKIRQARRR